MNGYDAAGRAQPHGMPRVERAAWLPPAASLQALPGNRVRYYSPMAIAFHAALSRTYASMPRLHIKQFRVAADAIDIHGHVNNQDYLRWMEEIAIEHSTAQGWPMERYLNSGGSWYVRSHFIEYLRPALLDDDITICTYVVAMTERDLPRRTLFLRTACRRRQILARAETLWTFVDIQRGRAVPIPDEVRAAFEIVESEDEVLREAGLPPVAG